MSDENVVPLNGPKCPQCGKKAVLKFKPFCSKRCADLDLGNWLDGNYRIPTDEAPTDGDFDVDEEDQRF